MGAGPGDPSPLGAELGVQFLTLILFGDGVGPGDPFSLEAGLGVQFLTPILFGDGGSCMEVGGEDEDA